MTMPRPRRPRLRPLDSYNRAAVGAVALGVLALVLAVVLVVNSTDFGQREVNADFAQAAQLESGDQVTVAGVPVGTVRSVDLAGDHVSVSLSLDSSVRLGSQTTAAIKLTTLLGNRYLELNPAGGGDLPGGRIPLAQTSVPYNLQTALQDATTTFQQVDADRLASALNETSGQLDGVPQLIPAALQNVRVLSGVIADRRDQIGSLLQSTSRLTTVVRRQQENLGQLVLDGASVLQEVQTRRASIQRLLDSATSVIQELKPIAVDDQPAIRSLLDNLADMTGMLKRNDALLRNLLQVLPVPWRSLNNLLGSGPEADVNLDQGGFVDSFMCAIATNLRQVALPPYSQDCK
ncbi:MCE family protein [uncultured Williamsia sp.]|uniref:MCE family protein n=1 Tax=uncultured Williamsia sp. TaxID=259311 RepID=UPI00261894F5|nr:MCE family protein [uncultured Williamsia sp.]